MQTSVELRQKPHCPVPETTVSDRALFLYLSFKTIEAAFRPGYGIKLHPGRSYATAAFFGGVSVEVLHLHVGGWCPGNHLGRTVDRARAHLQG